MRIAIVGGGAAGLAAAYYLSQKHELVLFEKNEDLGGNVRTLGKNTPGFEALESVNLDNGVIEFPANSAPRLTDLLSRLRVKTHSITGGSASFFAENGVSYHMPGGIRRMPKMAQRLPRYFRLLQAVVGFLPTLLRAKKLDPARPFGAYLSDGVMSKWLQGLIMYGYSMPYSEIEEFPAGLAANTLESMVRDGSWFRIEGGVYTYMQAIVDECAIDIRTGCADLQLTRASDHVVIHTLGSVETFDLVVLATPPHEVLKVVSDPDTDEKNCFRNWTENKATTVVHTDTSLYKGWNPPEFTEFDIFEKAAGQDAGYNAYLNRLVGISTDTPPHYFLAYNLNDRIDPARILHRWQHTTTRFQSATDTRAQIRRLNGSNKLYFAGAYLYNGLHEGAIESAWQVADQINHPG